MSKYGRHPSNKLVVLFGIPPYRAHADWLAKEGPMCCVAILSGLRDFAQQSSTLGSVSSSLAAVASEMAVPAQFHHTYSDRFNSLLSSQNINRNFDRFSLKSLQSQHMIESLFERVFAATTYVLL